jgi:uncharacterized membrane protein
MRAMPGGTLVFALSVVIGGIAGLRTVIPVTAVSWAASLGWLNLQDTWLAFLSLTWSPWILTVLALGELVTDQLPSTPSRTVPVQFAARLLSGALAGAAIGASGGLMAMGAIGGVIGAVFGTIGGHAFRAWLAAAFRRDLPAAVIEDLIAVGAAALLVSVLP